MCLTSDHYARVLLLLLLLLLLSLLLQKEAE